MDEIVFVGHMLRWQTFVTVWISVASGVAAAGRHLVCPLQTWSRLLEPPFAPAVTSNEGAC